MDAEKPEPSGHLRAYARTAFRLLVRDTSLGSRWGRSLANAAAVFLFLATADGAVVQLLMPPGWLREIVATACFLLAGVAGLFTFWWCYHRDEPPRGKTGQP